MCCVYIIAILNTNVSIWRYYKNNKDTNESCLYLKRNLKRIKIILLSISYLEGAINLYPFP